MIKKIIVDNKFTYLTDMKVRKGTKVLLPPFPWCQDPWIGKVTSLTSDYDGDCKFIITTIK